MLNPNGLEEEFTQKSQWCSIINGRLSNCYSQADYVLKYMFMPMMSKHAPIGLIPIFEAIEDDKDGTKGLKKAFNYDCTVETPGHMTYMESGGLILAKIPHSY